MDRQAIDRRHILAALSATGLSACAGGGGSTPSTTPIVTSPPPPPPPPTPPPVSTAALKDVFASDFLVGAAVQAGQVTSGGPDQSLAEQHFNSITAEFEMKADIIAPSEGNFDFDAGDTLRDFAATNGASLRGHALLWYRSTPDYFTMGSAADIRTRLETYIETVLAHYAGDIYAWDVVNEVVSDAASDTYRQDDWFQAVDKDYIDWAFQAARAADPAAKLFINDYNTELSGKRGRLITTIRDLLDRGIPVDGVGHQMHLSIDADAADALAAIDEIDALGAGLEQHVTELDISVYNDPGECFGSGVNCQTGYGTMASDVPDSVYQKQAQLYRDLFEGFKTRNSVTSVSLWGIRDSQSWLNNFPVSRPNYPLLFDDAGNPKTAFEAITDPDYVI
ncbi:MAG: endo-1,4-beta-xylanase [Pseudomonadota bacterium]